MKLYLQQNVSGIILIINVEVDNKKHCKDANARHGRTNMATT